MEFTSRLEWEIEGDFLRIAEVLIKYSLEPFLPADYENPPEGGSVDDLHLEVLRVVDQDLSGVEHERVLSDEDLKDISRKLLVEEYPKLLDLCLRDASTRNL